MLLLTSIQSIQGEGLYSPLSGSVVRVRGVVTGRVSRGFFIQDPAPDSTQPGSSGLFVFAMTVPDVPSGLHGALVEIVGTVVDFVPSEHERPTTQVLLQNFQVITQRGPVINVIWLDASNVVADTQLLRHTLNSLESMLVGIRKGAIFSAPSNPFGDYVLLPQDIASSIPLSNLRTALLDPLYPERWLPSFRISRVESAPIVNVGDILMQDVTGPLNYRAASYQISARGPLQVQRSRLPLETNATKPGASYTSVLTLNTFNLDQTLERAGYVDDARRDIDNDVADLRFEKLAAVIVRQAGAPAIIALQEIQDNDGAELSEVTAASLTYQRLIEACRELNGPPYAWAEIAPLNNNDGGQPGGNIRNAFLYDPSRVSLEPGSLRLIGDGSEAFAGSRKALSAQFRNLADGQLLTVINLHLASKRHQFGIFAPSQPGFDPRQLQRVAQAVLVREELAALNAKGQEYYVTGDFNDFDFSETLTTLCGDESTNLMETISPALRYDYNHRGKLHTLMHGIVSKKQATPGRFIFEILHGNELTGVQPGTMGTRATDHAYVIAHLRVGALP